jgi:hypothetical protein
VRTDTPAPPSWSLRHHLDHLGGNAPDTSLSAATLDTEPGKPVAVLDHNPTHLGIGQDLPQRGAVAGHTRPDLGHRRIQRDPAVTGFLGRRSTSSRWSADDTRQ